MHFEGIITIKYKMDSTNCKHNSQRWPAQQELAADAPQRPLRSRLQARLKLRVCARHGTELTGWKSPCQVIAEPKARRRARAPSRGDVWRKPNPNVRGDEQEPDRRCGTPGTSGHVTTKSSIRALGVLYKSGVYARTVLCLTLGDLPVVQVKGD